MFVHYFIRRYSYVNDVTWLQILFYWDMTPCWLLYRHRRILETCCLLLQVKPKILSCGYPIPISPGGIPTLLGLPWRWKQQTRPKRSYAYTSISWIMLKNGNVSIAVRTSNLVTLHFLLRSNAVTWEGDSIVCELQKRHTKFYSVTPNYPLDWVDFAAAQEVFVENISQYLNGYEPRPFNSLVTLLTQL